MSRHRKSTARTLTIPGSPGAWLGATLLGWLLYTGQLSQMISQLETLVRRLIAG